MTVPNVADWAFKLPYKKLSARLNSHKDKLLENLRYAYKCGPKDRPFDADKAWNKIEILASWYIARREGRQLDPKPSDRVDSYKRLADTLKLAHDMITDALASFDSAGDLIRAWKESSDKDGHEAGRRGDLLDAMTEFVGLVESIATLEAAASRAAKNAHKGPGAPKTSALPPGCIDGLASLYRESTGLKPTSTEDGPGVLFVCQLLTAIGHPLEENTVSKAIKDARARALKNPDRWGASPFAD
jgi:hypothetical protein